jgi:hypothetical protein
VSNFGQCHQPAVLRLDSRSAAQGRFTERDIKAPK